MGKFIDLTGKKFNRLTVIKRVENNKRNQIMWLCKCDCGNEIIVIGSHLKNNNTKSCGCWNIEKIIERNTSHGLSKTKMYKNWKDMRARCCNKNNKEYKNYGGRGIKICNEWLKDFKSFYDWSMQNGYKEDLSIDRIDVNGNYEPDNCRWATLKQQANNKRSNHYLTYNGETHTIAEWADKLGGNYSRIKARISALGWSVERALFTPRYNKINTNNYKHHN